MLLHIRSISLQILLLSIVILSCAQNYDPDYHISDDEESAGYAADESDSPDYTKYFNTPGSAPQLEENSENGFVTPLNFQSFFGSPQEGFSSGIIQDEVAPVKNTDGFVTDDFKQGFSDGPNFSSVDFFEQAQKESKNEESTEEEPKYISNNVPIRGGYQENVENLRKKSEKYKPLPIKAEEEKERTSYTNFKPSPVDLTQFTPTDPQYYKKYTQVPLAPYQLYSFQTPQLANYGLKQKNAPYNPTYLKYASPADANYEYVPSQTVTQTLRHNDCVKINKKVPSGKFNKEPMTCYVCKDPKSGGKAEHCSYEQEPSPKSYYRSSSQSYGNQQPDAYRIKREDSDSYDPYEEVKAKSHGYYSKPDEFEKNYYKAPDFSEFENYKVTEDKTDEPEEEKSYSEKQSEELVKQKDSCKKIHKEGVSCLICQNAETGGNYEQCSYQSEPNEKKYAYVRESKYDGDNEKDEESDSENESEKYTESETADDDKIPQHFAETTEKLRKVGVIGLDPNFYGSPDLKKKSKFKNTKYANQESKRQESKVKPETYYDPTGKREVEKVLEEFTKKDRSNCEQIKKQGMTCYLCVDAKGIKHEECMYVSESRPQSSLLAYHEKEVITDKPKVTESESKIKPVKISKKIVDSEAHASNQKIAKEKPPKVDPKPEFDVNYEGGLYSAETKPVYVKALGMTLPKYMVEKSEYEADFDRSAYSGRN